MAGSGDDGSASSRDDSGPGVREVVAEVGRGVAGPDVDLVIGLGARHPSTNGTIRLALRLSGDRVVAAEPVVGFLHRGAEKLFEVRDYRQILSLANRHDWLSSYGSELSVCLAVERMMGIEVPPRTVWLRTLLAELTRVLHHLHFLGSAPVGEATERVIGPLSADLREQIQRLLEELTGGRVHFMVNRIGGLGVDTPTGWPARTAACVDALRVGLDSLHAALQADDEMPGRTADVGRLSAGQALSYGASGPVARACGVDLDLRRDEPYLAYAELADVLRVVTRTAGDSAARFACLLEQCQVSLDLVTACLGRLPGGPVAVRLPKVVRPPEGQTYAWVENPAGLAGVLLVSHGEKTPWRLALRTASYANVQTLPALLVGAAVEEIPAVLASLFFTVGDIDK